MKTQLLITSFVLLIFLNMFYCVVSDQNDRISVQENDSFEGYILFTPEFSINTFLIDHNENIVNRWMSRNPQGIPAYLLENGSMIRGCAPGFGILTRFIMGGFTGSLEMYDWAGNLIWNFIMSNDTLCLHNDIEPLPNGNILVNAWEYKTVDDAIQKGWYSNKIETVKGFLIDCVLEIEPIYPYGGKIVWEWHEWDHLIQDYDHTKENFGIVKDHHELIDINAKGRLRIEDNQDNPRSVDFSHMNSIDYNQDLDQILLSLALLNEIIIIDHSTTTEESAGHIGGNYGIGGDILYRWGNPRNYGFGSEEDKMLFCQHDAQWIKEGYPGEGNILVFNNGIGRNEEYSSVDEFCPPITENGSYYRQSNNSYGPNEFLWSYITDPKCDFYSSIMSGAQRLSDGNTLISDGLRSRFFVVTPEKEVIWDYINWRPFPFFTLNRVFKFDYYPLDYPGIIL